MKAAFSKTTISSLFLILLLHNSCKKENNNLPTKGKGTVSLQLSQNGTMVEANGNLKSANVNDFVVEIYDKNNVLLKSYAKLSDVPAKIELDKGEYYAVAYSTNSSKAAFDNPTYYGQSDHIVIVGGDQKSADVKCYISNAKVTVVYSDSVKTKFYDYSVKVFNLTDTLQYIKDDTREGFFKAGNLGIEAHLFFKKIDGTSEEKVLHGTISSAKAMKHYQLLIDASIVKGNSSISVTAIDSMSTEIVSISETPTVQATKTVSQLVAGDLLLTEVMADPDKVTDTYGEWFEIYNNATFPININGLIVKVGTKIYTVSISHEMQIGEYVFFGKDAQGGAGALVYYSSAISLVNSSGGIQLLSTDGVTEIASMTYTTAPTGASLSLDPTKMTYTLAKDPSSWCTATQAYSTGDKGTPGTANSACN
jgi:hypothetical protein